MASEAKIRERIAAIIGRPNSVRFEEIKWVMDQLGFTEKVTRHTRMFRLKGHRLMINQHNNGKNTVPAYSVDEFMKLMTELELY
jgi:hypothetical protein